MALVRRVLALVTFWTSIAHSAEARRCFACTDAPLPQDCSKVTTCGTGETCFVEEIVKASGNVVYNSGCMPSTRCRNSGIQPVGKRSDITTCIDCCDGDFCNNKGCLVTAIPPDQRGLYCFTCEAVADPKKCEFVSLCSSNELCGLSIPQHSGFPDEVYKSECLSKQVCQALQAHPSHLPCPPTCCNTDFCNTQCNATVSGVITHAPAPSTTTSTTRLSTTSTTTTTTTKPTTTTHQHCKNLGETSHCPNGHHYDRHTGICIKVIDSHNATWTEAQTACAAMGDNLVTIDTADKMTAVEQVIKDKNPWYWIGGRDIHDTTTFYWNNGHKFSYTNWGGHDDVYQNQQPDDSTTNPQNCVIIVPLDHYRWHDDQCWQRNRYYICEHSSTKAPITPSYSCNTHGGYKSYGDGLCLKIHTEHMTWQQAKTHCEKDGTGLVVLETQQKSEALRNYLNKHYHRHSSNFWIGGQDRYKNKVFYWENGEKFDNHVDWDKSMNQPDYRLQGHDEDCVTMYDHQHSSSFWIGGQDRYQNNVFYWENGEKFDNHVDWDKSRNQPDYNFSNGDDEDCVIMYGGSQHHLHDAICSNKYMFICQRS